MGKNISKVKRQRKKIAAPTQIGTKGAPKLMRTVKKSGNRATKKKNDHEYE